MWKEVFYLPALKENPLLVKGLNFHCVCTLLYIPERGVTVLMLEKAPKAWDLLVCERIGWQSDE
jgi:hypothetical protein